MDRVLWISLAGAAGTAARYLLTVAITQRFGTSFPAGTMVVNLTGCFIIAAVMSAGAYGAVQAGTYNTRPLVPEVLVREGEWALIRPRMEIETLIGLDRLPPWL